VGYGQMTPVQASSLPAILAGRDVVAQARTGSGKTAAFALGLLSALDATSSKLHGLVLVPTRELADQVSREIRRLARFIPNVKVLTLCGGVPLRPHLASLSHEPHIVVGTPGRVLIASDVAARGLDITDLPMVINFDIAANADTHLHLIGRTGRAGRRGVALSLCLPRESDRAKLIEDRVGEPLQWDNPTFPTESTPLLAPFVTIAVDAGRQQKLRPGDLLGALTGDAEIPATAVGKIDVFPTRTYVAIARDWHEKALQGLRTGKIKGRTIRVRRIDG
jgi:superfamily II DNA/RNA helicase